MRNRIRELRKAHGLTMKKFGAILGLGESTISQYETGKRVPDIDTLVKIADYFGVPLGYLVCLEEDYTQRVEEPLSFNLSEVHQSKKIDDYFASCGYKFYDEYPDIDSKTWICVDYTQQKLYLLPPEDTQILYKSVRDFVKFQISELLKKGQEIPDTDGWFKK